MLRANITFSLWKQNPKVQGDLSEPYAELNPDSAPQFNLPLPSQSL
jgi:hypothetical protein